MTLGSSFRSLLLIFFLPKLGLASDDPAVSLRLVADHVLRHTTRQLIDRSTGETFTTSSHLPLKAEISIESKFNAWFYQTWLLTDGMRRAAEALQEPRYQGYGEANLDFLYQHLDYFQRQHDAGMKASPVGDGKLSPIGFYFKISELWHTGLAPLVLERSMAHQDSIHAPYLARVREFLRTCPRFDDGLFHRPRKGAMTDDPYMTVPYLVRAQRYEEAIAQVLGTHARLFDPQKRLLKHLWDLKQQRPAGVFWGRGNGWTVLAHVELLTHLPHDHPQRQALLRSFISHMEGLRDCADPSGGWHQVLDHPESWLETSATGMLTYGMARGINEGWLDASFTPTVLKAWAALQTKLTPEGDLLDVCASTDVGDLDYYLQRPRLQGDLHGFGSFLLAGAEVVRLQAATNSRR